MNTNNKQQGSSLPEVMVTIGIVLLVAYFLMAWAMGTADISQWPAIMELSSSEIVRLFWEILHRAGMVESVLS